MFMTKHGHASGLLLMTVAVGWLLALPPAVSAAAAQPVTFNDDIAPILLGRCGPCHRPGGWAPFSLLTYSAARERADRIAAVTKSRRMPPWKTEPGYGPFVGLRALGEVEIDLIQRWVRDGRREGAPRDLAALRPPAREWRLGTPDLIVTLPQAYTVPAGGPDVFRVFVVRLPTSTTRHVRGLEFLPGNPRVVHHANLLLDPTPRSRALDAADPKPGYEGATPRSAGFPQGHFLGWVPGLPAPLLPDSLSWPLEPGTDLVVQLHFLPSGRPETVQPLIGFYFADVPPARIPSLLRLGRQDIDIAPGDGNHTISDSYALPVDAAILAIKPHAHYRAREIRATATLPDGTTKRLLHIKDWDFKWQHTYRFAEPLDFPKATTLRMQYTYDNSADNPRNPQLPPRRVRWGPSSFDEMGDLWIQVLTKEDSDRITLEQDFRRQAAAAEIVGYQALIENEPANSALHDEVAMLFLELGRPNDAVSHFEVSLRLQPDSAASHFNLGTALTMAGDLDESIRRYRKALRLDPDRAHVHLNLGNALASQGRTEDALDHYRSALRLEPEYARARNNVGNVLMGLGRLEEAASHLREALRIDAELPDAHFNLALMLLGRRELPEAVDHLRIAVRLRPDWTAALTRLAWVLATASDGRVRDAAEAVRLAEHTARLTRRRDAQTLDVLAAAHAAAGRFDRALRIIQEAVALDPSASSLSGMLARRELYAARQPYREIP